jgi:hypothetical protein
MRRELRVVGSDAGSGGSVSVDETGRGTFEGAAPNIFAALIRLTPDRDALAAGLVRDGWSNGYICLGPIEDQAGRKGAAIRQDTTTPAALRHRDLRLLGIEVRDVPLEDNTLDENTEVLVAAIRSLSGDEERAWSVEQAAKHPRGKGGRFAKLTAIMGAALHDFLKGDGPDDPLAKFDREQVRRAAKALEADGMPAMRRGASEKEIKDAILEHARQSFREVDAADKARPKPSAKFTLKGDGKPDPKLVREVEVENKIRAAYRDLPKLAGGWVHLSDLRDNLGDLSREDTDAALLRLSRQKGVRLDPLDMGVRLDTFKPPGRRDREAALDLGGTPHQILAIEDPSPRPLPKAEPSKLRNKDVAVYHEADGKVSLYEESDSGVRGARVMTAPELAGLEKWASDNGETELADWAAKEQGVAPAKKAAPAKVAKARARDAGRGTEPAPHTPEWYAKLDAEQKARQAAALADLANRSLRDAEVDNRLRAAYAAARPNGGWVAIADLRDEMSDIPRSEQDAALKRLANADLPGGARIIPIANIKALTERDRAAALHMGGEDHHAVSFQDPSPLPMPTSATPGVDRYRRINPDRPRAPANKAAPAALSTDPAVRAVEVDNRVREAYSKLAAKPGTWVGLADLRDNLGDLSREEQDAALTKMLLSADYNDPGRVRIIPVANTKALKPRDRAAALRIGNEDNHAIWIGDPSPRPLPKGEGGKPEVAAPAKAVKKAAPSAPRPAASTDEVVAGLADAKSRDEAHGLLAGLTLAELKAVAKALDVAPERNKTEYQQSIVDATVGVRNDALAIKNADLQSPARKALDALTGANGLSTDPAIRAVQIDNRVRAAYAHLAASPGAWVGLADLRNQLGEDTNRHEVDASLKRLEQEPGANIVPESNQKTLTQADRDAAVVIGDQAKHAVMIEDPSPRSLPGAAPTTKAAPRKRRTSAARDCGLALAGITTRALGHDVTPGHDQLHHYWTVDPKGRARWVDSATPWTTLEHLLEEHVPPEMAKRLAASFFHDVFHYWPGDDKNRVAHGKPPRGNRIGPG